MTLNLTDSKLFVAAVKCQEIGGNAVLEWMHDNTTDFSNQRYSDIRTNLFLAAESAYEESPSNLYITNGSGEHQVEGIDQFPIPPER